MTRTPAAVSPPPLRGRARVGVREPRNVPETLSIIPNVPGPATPSPSLPASGRELADMQGKRHDP